MPSIGIPVTNLKTGPGYFMSMKVQPTSEQEYHCTSHATATSLEEVFSAIPVPATDNEHYSVSTVPCNGGYIIRVLCKVCNKMFACSEEMHVKASYRDKRVAEPLLRDPLDVFRSLTLQSPQDTFKAVLSSTAPIRSATTSVSSGSSAYNSDLGVAAYRSFVNPTPPVDAAQAAAREANRAATWKAQLDAMRSYAAAVNDAREDSRDTFNEGIDSEGLTNGPSRYGGTLPEPVVAKPVKVSCKLVSGGSVPSNRVGPNITISPACIDDFDIQCIVGGAPDESESPDLRPGGYMVSVPVGDSQRATSFLIVASKHCSYWVFSPATLIRFPRPGGAYAYLVRCHYHWTLRAPYQRPSPSPEFDDSAIAAVVHQADEFDTSAVPVDGTSLPPPVIDGSPGDDKT